MVTLEADSSESGSCSTPHSDGISHQTIAPRNGVDNTFRGIRRIIDRGWIDDLRPQTGIIIPTTVNNLRINRRKDRSASHRDRKYYSKHLEPDPRPHIQVERPSNRK